MKRLSSISQANPVGLPVHPSVKPIRGLFIILLLLLGSQSGYSQQVQVIRLPALEKTLNRNSDTTYVVNVRAHPP